METNINNSIKFVHTLSYLDWLGNFYLMSVIYPLQTRAELYILDFVEDTSSIGLSGQSDCLKRTWKSEQCFISIKKYPSLIMLTKVCFFCVIGKKVVVKQLWLIFSGYIIPLKYLEFVKVYR